MTAPTNGEGTFTLLDVSPGRYILRVDSPGFATWAREVVVAARMATINVTLEIGGLIEDVQVSGSAPYNLSKPIPTASRIGLSPLETPASVAVVSGDLVRSLGTQTLIVAKSLAPGMTSSAPMGNGGNVLDAKLTFRDNWTNLETVWTPSPTLSVHNSTFFLYNSRVYHDAPNYACISVASADTGTDPRFTR